MLGGHATTRQNAGSTSTILKDEVLGILTRLNARQHLAHGVLGVLGDDLRTRDVLAILGIVRNRIIHIADTAFVHQVDDQLQFMQTFEVSHLRRITRLDQHLVAFFHQLDTATTQHALLAEKIGLGFFLERGLDNAGLAATNCRSVRHRQSTRLARGVLMHSDQTRHSAALCIG